MGERYCHSFLRPTGLGVTYRCMWYHGHSGAHSSPVYPQNPKRLNGTSTGFWVNWSRDA